MLSGPKRKSKARHCGSLSRPWFVIVWCFHQWLEVSDAWARYWWRQLHFGNVGLVSVWVIAVCLSYWWFAILWFSTDNNRDHWCYVEIVQVQQSSSPQPGTHLSHSKIDTYLLTYLLTFSQIAAVFSFYWQAMSYYSNIPRLSRLLTGNTTCILSPF